MKYKPHLKKMLLAYFLSLEARTCVITCLYIESFFTMFHSTYHSCSFSTEKNYQTQHLDSKIKIDFSHIL